MFLDILVFLPLLWGLVIWLYPTPKRVHGVAFFLSLIHFFFTLSLFFIFDPSSPDVQLASQLTWVPSMGIQYFLGIDGLSFWLVILTSFLMPLVCLGSWKTILKKQTGFYVNLFLLQTTLLGSFLALDTILFYVFFEISLIPMSFMIGVWGGRDRIYAALKFFIYTFSGSICILLGFIFLILMTKSQLGFYSAHILDFYKLDIPFVSGAFFSTQTLLFFIFCLGFAIKIPLFPFHTWLPDAHVEAPTPGSVILAGVMLKLGAYGFLRFCLPLFPQAVAEWAWLFLFLGVVGIIYGALLALAQSDLKKLVAYSSISHMGYIILGIFAFTELSLTGSLYQMLNHAISTGGLFFLVGMIYEKTHTRQINHYGGIASLAPIYTIFFFIIMFSSMAVPLTNGFIGEFLILIGSFSTYPVFTGFAVLGVILGAIYMLWMAKRVFFGKQLEGLKAFNLELSLREGLLLVPFVILIFWMGLFPHHFLSWSEASLKHLKENRYHYQLEVRKP